MKITKTTGKANTKKSVKADRDEEILDVPFKEIPLAQQAEPAAEPEGIDDTLNLEEPVVDEYADVDNGEENLPNIEEPIESEFTEPTEEEAAPEYTYKMAAADAKYAVGDAIDIITDALSDFEMDDETRLNYTTALADLSVLSIELGSLAE